MTLLAALAGLAALQTSGTPMNLEDVVAAALRVRPSERQVRWHRAEFAVFFHFGMNTFTDREWGEGTESPALFNPTDLDARQWVRAAKDAGARQVILTAKHHDGFCLWPSAFTDHDVAASPWKQGKGDVVREVADACRQEGMRFGVYLSPWDRHEPSYGTDEYNVHFKNQLRELLTQYGPVDEVWFDGANGEGPNGKRQVYDWDGYYALIRELQPQATIAIAGPDVRWCGNEAGVSRAAEWNVVATHDAKGQRGSPFSHDDPDLGSRAKLAEALAQGFTLGWYPAEVDTSIRPGWFYHAAEDNQVKSLEHLLDIYLGSVGGNAGLLLNVPPDRRGRIHENDVRRLRELGSVIGRTFETSVAAGAATSAKATLDGDPDTFVAGSTFEYDLGRARPFNTASFQEPIREGQRIERLVLEAEGPGGWTQLAEAQTVGHKRIVRFPTTSAQRVRVRILEARGEPLLASFGLHHMPAVVRPPIVRRDPQGRVTIEAPDDCVVRYTVYGNEPNPRSALYSGPFDLAQGGRVRAVATPRQGRPAGIAQAEVVAEFGITKGGWKVLGFDSEEVGEEARRAIDDDPRTYWHTAWRDSRPGHPHEIAIDLGRTVRIGELSLLPRQDGAVGGILTEALVYASNDPKDWGEPVARPKFGNVEANPVRQRIPFDRPVEARYLRIVSVAAAKAEPWASIAELDVHEAPR